MKRQFRIVDLFCLLALFSLCLSFLRLGNRRNDRATINGAGFSSDSRSYALHLLGPSKMALLVWDRRDEIRTMDPHLETPIRRPHPVAHGKLVFFAYNNTNRHSEAVVWDIDRNREDRRFTVPNGQVSSEQETAACRAAAVWSLQSISGIGGMRFSW